LTIFPAIHRGKGDTHEFCQAHLGDAEFVTELLHAAWEIQGDFGSRWHNIPRSLLYAYIQITRKIIQVRVGIF
jgi:hypothetical protein